MKGRRRDIHLHVMVTAEELAGIRERMDEAGITNAGAYMRKMALNGYILHVDLSPVKELVSLQRRCANNLNQVKEFNKDICSALSCCDGDFHSRKGSR